jgi:hypothetical protein
MGCWQVKSLQVRLFSHSNENYIAVNRRTILDVNSDVIFCTSGTLRRRA